MKYRIVKKYYRKYSSAKVDSYYSLEYLGIDIIKTILFLGKMYKWKTAKKFAYYGCGDSCYEEIRFDTLKEAREHKKNLEEPVYEKEVF